MKTHRNWSYNPYRPLFFESGDIYICRIVPSEKSIHIEWLGEEMQKFSIFVRKRNEREFSFVGSTEKTEFTMEGLERNCDYEFYVESDERKSRIRLARCGEVVDTVVNYLHPEDMAYSFSGNFLCSPSLVRHPEGYLLASMDLFGHSKPQNLTLIYRSDDNGATWDYVSELFPCFWGKLFIYENELYVLACATEYGDLLIGKSSDGGKTFGESTVLFRGANGKNSEPGVHKNPQPVVEFDGRIWNTLEYGSWARGYHAVMVMSAKVGSDLLDADSWLFSEPVKYDSNWTGVPEGESVGNIEGVLVESKGKLYNIMRYDMTKMQPNYGYVLAYEVNTKEPEKPLRFSHCIKFPANHSKFEIKYDKNTKRYYSIASRIIDENHNMARNLLSLMASDDLENWHVVKDIVDKTDDDKDKVGFQYVDFIIEGEKIIYLCRTAMNGAHTFHDSNYITFGELEIQK